MLQFQTADISAAIPAPVAATSTFTNQSTFTSILPPFCRSTGLRGDVARRVVQVTFSVRLWRAGFWKSSARGAARTSRVPSVGRHIGWATQPVAPGGAVRGRSNRGSRDWQGRSNRPAGEESRDARAGPSLRRRPCNGSRPASAPIAWLREPRFLPQVLGGYSTNASKLPSTGAGGSAFRFIQLHLTHRLYILPHLQNPDEFRPPDTPSKADSRASARCDCAAHPTNRDPFVCRDHHADFGLWRVPACEAARSPVALRDKTNGVRIEGVTSWRPVALAR